MLVSTENLQSILDGFTNMAAVDTETTGLNSFKDDKLFSIILSDERDNYYLNFLAYPEENISPLPIQVIDRIRPIFEDESRIWFLQNAKFDMHMLSL